jgi:cyclohexa-1,5-dienecarbonyl-CoA hydratase
MSAESPSVSLTVRDDVAYLALEAPPYNILTCDLMERLRAALGQAAADSSLKAIALTASGKAFSAGADVGEHAPERAADLMRSFGGLFRELAALELPLVMAVDGAALGGGFELVMMADVLLASERATFGQPEIRLGFFAPVGVVRLPALVGPAKATEITCSGRTYSAEEMQRCGLVARVVPSTELGPALEATLDEFRRASPLILRMNVRVLKRLAGRPFTEALAQAEAAFLDELMATQDVREGIASFFEKRRPMWKNR